MQSKPWWLCSPTPARSLNNGEYFDWGYNAKGQLGSGRLGGQSDVPVRVRLQAAVVQVAQGG